jgi:hypothetical protein
MKAKENGGSPADRAWGRNRAARGLSGGGRRKRWPEEGARAL